MGALPLLSMIARVEPSSLHWYILYIYIYIYIYIYMCVSSSFTNRSSQKRSLLLLQGSDGGVRLYWGTAADGSVVISDDLEVIKAGCAKSFAPFPTGTLIFKASEMLYITQF
jgi:hypothetical protein